MSAPKTTQDPPATTVLAEELAEIAWGRGGDPHRRASRQANSNGPPIEFDTPEVLQDAADRDLCGLALSGGGIRSATFNLGVIQALAELGQLSKIDYLSTVSGGGYIGSWLTAWIHRGGGVEAVEKKLATAVPAPQRESAAPPPRYEEQAEIGFLREHSNYLTPRVGVLGADTWSAISTYLRNLVLNLTILIVALLPLVLVPRVMFDFVRWLSGAALADVVVAPWHRLAEATTWLSTTAAPRWLGTIAQMVSAASTSITDFLMATMPESAQGLPGAQTLAFVALLAAAAMTGMNLRYLRKGIVVINGERGDEHRSRKERLERWFPRQSAVLLTIVAPAAAGAAFIAASMLYSRAMTGRDFAFLVGGYLVLFIALVLVWRPERQRVAGGLFAKLWAAWFVVLALLYAAPAAVLAAAMGYWLSGSTLTSLSATWMVVGVPVVVAIFSASVVLHLGLMGRWDPLESTCRHASLSIL